MSIDANDLIESFLDDQARVNAAVDNGDINNLVGDVGGLSDPIGMQADSLVSGVTTPPHKYDDNQSAYGFASWA